MKKIILLSLVGYSIFYIFTAKDDTPRYQLPKEQTKTQTYTVKKTKQVAILSVPEIHVEDFSYIEQRMNHLSRPQLEEKVHELDMAIGDFHNLSYAEMSAEQLLKFNNLNRQLSVALKRLIDLKHGRL